MLVLHPALLLHERSPPQFGPDHCYLALGIRLHLPFQAPKVWTCSSLCLHLCLWAAGPAPFSLQGLDLSWTLCLERLVVTRVMTFMSVSLLDRDRRHLICLLDHRASGS